MSDPVALPAMTEAQAASWNAMMDLYAKVPEHWTLVGGQLVHLHCAERSSYSTRPTTDADAVVNIRADQRMLARFTAALDELGFTPATSAAGHQHRWLKGLAQVDVLIPEASVSAPRSCMASEEHQRCHPPARPRPSRARRRSRSSSKAAPAPSFGPTSLRPRRQGRRPCRTRWRQGGVSSLCRLRSTGFAARRPRSARVSAGEEGPPAPDQDDPLCRKDGPAMLVEDADEHLGRLQRAIDR